LATLCGDSILEWQKKYFDNIRNKCINRPIDDRHQNRKFDKALWGSGSARQHKFNHQCWGVVFFTGTEWLRENDAAPRVGGILCTG
jgi:hypothetical protein